MSRIKLALLGLAGAVVASAVTASVAAAAPEFWESLANVAVPAGSAMVASPDRATFNTRVAGDRVEIECLTNTFAAETEAAGLNKGKMTFNRCYVFEIVNGMRESKINCTAKITNNAEKNRVAFKAKLIENPNTSGIEYELTTNGLPALLIIEIEGTCGLAGTIEALGSLSAEIAQATIAGIFDRLVFTGRGSNVATAGGTAVAFTALIPRFGFENERSWFVKV